MTWYHPALARGALDEGDAEIKRLKAENDRLRALFPPELLMAAYQALAFVARHDPTYPEESERRAEDFKSAVRLYEQKGRK